MKCVYISPSVQEFNKYLNGGSEEEYMNLIADATIRYLNDYGICYSRNSPEMSVRQVVDDSNSGNYILHLAIHSNASPENLSGLLSGSEIFYFPTSMEGKLFAEIIANNLRQIYREPEKVTVKPSTSLYEIRRSRAPAVLVEVAYHDNVDDERWITQNIDAIGLALANSIREYINDTESCPSSKIGEVLTMGGNLNLRSAPNLNSSVINKISNGQRVEILGCDGRFYKVRYNNSEGYVSKKFVIV